MDYKIEEVDIEIYRQQAGHEADFFITYVSFFLVSYHSLAFLLDASYHLQP